MEGPEGPSQSYPHLQVEEAGGRAQVFDPRACRGWSPQPPLVSPVQVWASPGTGTSPCAGACGWAARLPREHRRPAARRGVSGFLTSRISWHHLPWAGATDGQSPGLAAPSSGPWWGGGAAAASPSRWEPEEGPGPRGPGSREIAGLPTFTPGNREVVFICYRMWGLWRGLMVVETVLFHPSHRLSRCSSHGNCGVARQQWVLRKTRPL